MSGYFTATVADGISGDDVNRRRREWNLGFSAPSKDWVNCNAEHRCLWAKQHVKNAKTLTGKIMFHMVPATFLGIEVIDAYIKDGDPANLQYTY